MSGDYTEATTTTLANVSTDDESYKKGQERKSHHDMSEKSPRSKKGGIKRDTNGIKKNKGKRVTLK